MNHKSGKIFAIGHASFPLILLILYASGYQHPLIIGLALACLLWSLFLIWQSYRTEQLFSIFGSKTHIFFGFVDFLLLCAIYLMPNTTAPIWLVLFLMPLYAFELGVKRTLHFSVLALFATLLYKWTHQERILTTDMLITTLGVVANLLFLGPHAERLNRLALVDNLTELPNRLAFLERLTSEITEVNKKKSQLAVMFLDLDHFKYINDTMGHKTGDKLLLAVTKRLVTLLPPNVRIYRMGGDEFTFILPSKKSADQAKEIAEHIVKAFQDSFTVNQHEVFITASMGISIYPVNSQDAEQLMKHAETAMYRAKETGRNSFQFYLKLLDEDGIERVKLETMLRHALERNELVVYYQPRVDTITGNLVCTEALVRWMHPQEGMISPKDFIPLAEDTGLIVQVGEQVLRKACAQRKKWFNEGYTNFRLSVNFSPRQFKQADMPETIAQALKASGLPPELLELEITESAAMQDVNYAILMLRVLKEMGLTIAIDDFGTGYSSLSYLKKFPIDVLKIDQSFTSGIHKDADDAAIVRAIIAMGNSLKLDITAEGVETSEQLLFLEQLKCREVQGYLIGKPMNAETFEEWMKLHYSLDGQRLSNKENTQLAVG